MLELMNKMENILLIKFENEPRIWSLSKNYRRKIKDLSLFCQIFSQIYIHFAVFSLKKGFDLRIQSSTFAKILILYEDTQRRDTYYSRVGFA